MSSIFDKVKQGIFEEEDKPVKQAPAPVTVAPSIPTTAPLTSATYPVATVAPVATDGSVYQRLVAATNFDATPTGACLKSYLEPLAALPLDADTKLKTAFAQAAAREHLTVDTVMRDIGDLQVKLDHENNLFQNAASSFADKIAADKRQIESTSAQIQTLQKQLADLTVSVANEEQTAQTRAAEFTAAFQARKNEIDQQRSHYTAVLKG